MIIGIVNAKRMNGVKMDQTFQKAMTYLLEKRKLIGKKIPSEKYILDRDIKWSTRVSIISSAKSRVDQFISRSNLCSLLGVPSILNFTKPLFY